MAEVNKDDLSKGGSDFTNIKTKEEVGKNLSPASNKKPGKPKAKEAEKKQTFGERVASNFMNIDYGQIKDRLLFDWLFPEIISTLGDILRMIFSKDGTGRTGSSVRRRKDGYTPYSSIYEKQREQSGKDPTRQDFRKIRLEFYEREDAEEVLGELRERLESSNVGWVPVRDLYSLADLTTNSTMVKWGWRDLEDCIIERRGENYVLCMPPAEPR